MAWGLEPQIPQRRGPRTALPWVLIFYRVHSMSRRGTQAFSRHWEVAWATPKQTCGLGRKGNKGVPLREQSHPQESPGEGGLPGNKCQMQNRQKNAFKKEERL